MRINYREKEKDTNKAKLSSDDIPHIFRNKEGHLSDTAENRKLLIDMASDKSNFLGIDKYRTRWFGKILSNGKQIWATLRGNLITNGGLNDAPRTFNNQTGLSRMYRK